MATMEYAVFLTRLALAIQDITAGGQVTFDTPPILALGDMVLSQVGKGVVLKNAAGTVTKRVRLNDAGNGLLYEDP